MGGKKKEPKKDLVDKKKYFVYLKGRASYFNANNLFKGGYYEPFAAGPHRIKICDERRSKHKAAHFHYTFGKKGKRFALLKLPLNMSIQSFQ